MLPTKITINSASDFSYWTRVFLLWPVQDLKKTFFIIFHGIGFSGNMKGYFCQKLPRNFSQKNTIPRNLMKFFSQLRNAKLKVHYSNQIHFNVWFCDRYYATCVIHVVHEDFKPNFSSVHPLYMQKWQIQNSNFWSAHINSWKVFSVLYYLDSQFGWYDQHIYCKIGSS